ncbi:MAG: HU family DNA-binding protein [Ignavibacteria bacterium]|nr:HU family DNA-binding protein [Ignavibacteria bacterium]
MNSTNLISKISAKFNISKKKCELIFDKIFDGIKMSIKEKKEFNVENFGSFKVVRRKMQKMIDYNKKAVVLLPPKDKLVFYYFNGVEEQNVEQKKKELQAKEIIKNIADEYNINEIEVYNYYYTLFDIIKECFRKNINVNILEFGKFKISGKGKVSFSPAKKFQDDINYNFNNLETVIIRTLTPTEFASLTKEEEKRILEETKEDTAIKDTFEIEAPVDEITEEEPYEEQEIKPKEEVIEDLLDREKEIIKIEVEEISKKFDEEKLRLKEEIDELRKRIDSLEILDKKIRELTELGIKGLEEKKEIETPEVIGKEAQKEVTEIERETQQEAKQQVEDFAEREQEIEMPKEQELMEIEKETREEEEQLKKLTELESRIQKEEVQGLKEIEEHIELKEPEIKIEEPVEKKIEESWEESFERKWRELREKIFSTPSEIEELKPPSLAEEITEKLIEPEPTITTPTIEEKAQDAEEQLTETIIHEAPTKILEEKDAGTIFEEPELEEKDITPAYPEVFEDEDTLSISEIYGRLKESFSYISTEQGQKEEDKAIISEKKGDTLSTEKPKEIETELRESFDEKEAIIKEEPTEIVDTSMDDVIRRYERLREKLKEELIKDEISFPDEIISEKPITPIEPVPEEIKDVDLNGIGTDNITKISDFDISEFDVIEETEDITTKPISSIEDLEERKVKDELSESIDRTLQEIKSYMDEIARKEKLPLSNSENNIEKETPFKALNDIELPKSIDDYFEQITRDNIKKFPDINDEENKDITDEEKFKEKE